MQIFRNLVNLIICLSVCLTTSACGDGKGSDDPKKNEPTTVTFSINPAELSAGPDAQTLTLEVTADADWSISSDADWCTVRPGGGVKNTPVKVNVNIAKHTALEARNAVLTVKSGQNTRTVTVKQNPAPAVNLSMTKLMFGAQAAEGVVKINSNTDWKAESNADWCTIAPQTGSTGEKDLTVKVAANSGKQTRDARITISYEGGSQDIAVSQLSDEIITPEGYQLVWNDEFNKDGEPGDEWWYETGAGGWGNNEIQNYVKCKAPNGDALANISNGILSITCKNISGQVYSIRMNTAKAWTYGYFEARLKCPGGKGTWPAFWMMPKNFTAWPDDGEIDIMEEVGYNPDKVQSTIHCKAYNHSIGTQRGSGDVSVPGAESEFHVYACEWTADFIRFFFDGKQVFRFDNDKKGNKDTWPFNAPFYLKLNLAWGGNWGGAQGIDEKALPAVYQIDYVRVFQK